MPLLPALVERFCADVEALTGGVPDRLGIAVSGGPDSLALLLLAAAAYPGRVAAATVDHRLRPASGDEAALVALICAGLNVPHETLTIDWSPPPIASLQARAREQRYAQLNLWARAQELPAYATAHHVDDQAETLLMRLARGAGVGGLSGVRSAYRVDRSAPRVIRPLLGWRKAELEQIVAAAGLTPVTDPANTDNRYDRTHARALLAATPWLNPQRLAGSAVHLAQAEDALRWSAARLWDQRVSIDERSRAVLLDVRDLPDEYRRRLLIRALREVRAAQHLEADLWRPRGPDLDRLIARLDHPARASATLGEVLCTSHEESRWQLAPAPPRALASKAGAARAAAMHLTLLTPDASYADFRSVWEARVQHYTGLLAPHGLVVEPVAWTDAAPTQPALASLAWGYHLQPERWDALLAAWPADVPLFNAPSLLRWNSDKRYLAALSQAHVATVPTHFVPIADAAAIAAARAAFAVDDLVAKPRVSASAHATTRVGPADAAPDLPDAMIQPFLSTVQTEGELSLFYFAGTRAHAVRKVAAAGDFRVQREYGGVFTAVEPTAAEIALAEAALGVAPAVPLYARVDMVTGPSGAPLIMELELVEPDLYLDFAPDAGASFAAALAAALIAALR